MCRGSCFRSAILLARLRKPEWANPSKFQFNPAFDLGFLEIIDPDYEHYATLLDGISDLDVLFGDGPLKPERPSSKRFKHCAYAEEATSAGFALKDVTCHKRFGPITTSPESEKAVILSNTEASTRWAVKNFNLCATNRSAVKPSDPVPADLLHIPFAHTFSGSFSNCTITVFLK